MLAKFLIPAAAALCLSACASTPEALESAPKPAPDGEPPGACHGDRAQFAMGLPYSPGLAEQARAASGAATVRRKEPGKMYTQEFREDRLNLETDENGRIIRVACG